MGSYNDIVKNALDKKENFNISCSAYKNTKIVLEKMINQSKKSLSLFISHYDKFLYEGLNVNNLFLDFIKKNNGKGFIRIISSNNCIKEMNKEGGLLEKLFLQYSKYQETNHLRVYRLLDENIIKIDGDSYNFIFTENEPSFMFGIANKGYPRIANFGDYENYEKLKDIFYKAIEKKTQKVIL